jgi:hypothetical protein
VEATRYTSGPCTAAVGEMGAPPTGLPALVPRRREHRVPGVCARTESRALEAMGPNPIGRCQTAQDHRAKRSTCSQKKTSYQGLTTAATEKEVYTPFSPAPPGATPPASPERQRRHAALVGRRGPRRAATSRYRRRSLGLAAAVPAPGRRPGPAGLPAAGDGECPLLRAAGKRSEQLLKQLLIVDLHTSFGMF